MTTTKDETPVTSEGASTKKAKSDAYGAAVTRLKDENRGRFNELVGEEMAKRGIEWSPRPTAEEKAAAEIKRLVSENPNLVGNAEVRAALGL